MASISTYLDTRRAKTSGKFPLKFNISINRGRKFLINLNIEISKEQWSGSEIIKHDRKQMLNQYIRSRITQIEDELIRLEITGQINTMPLEQVKQRIETIFSRTSGSQEYLVKSHWEHFLTFKTKKATRASYDQTLLKIGGFTDLENFSFKDITPLWLRCFEQFMKDQGLAINSIAINMRNIRSVFNDAIDTDQVDQSAYPFRKFKIKSEKTEKRSLSVDDLRKFRDYKCESHQEKYRDFFMLIFYMQGINIVDLLVVV